MSQNKISENEFAFPELLKSIGKTIAARRKACKLTQKQISAKTKITYRYFQMIEAGQVNVTISTLQRICLALEIGIADIFNKPVTEEAI